MGYCNASNKDFLFHSVLNLHYPKEFPVPTKHSEVSITEF